MRPGERIAGHYEIIRAVNTGGLSVVYAAEDVRSHEQVAVKIINLTQAAASLKERIEREVRILTDLEHPHIVQCFDSGHLDDRRMFLVLEWLEGKDLADFKADAPISLRLVLQLSEQVAGALSVAHRQGIVHRDIKPANIYMLEMQMGSEPICKVLDFGVAKSNENAALTRAGAILGTPAYMAPEQADSAMAVDGRADLFSLGVLAYELLTGRLPWTSTTDLARLARIMIEQPIPVKETNPEVPNSVAALIDGLLLSNPEHRTARAADVLRQVRSCLRELPEGVLDTIYTKDQKTLEQVVRADTLDVEPLETGKSSGAFSAQEPEERDEARSYDQSNDHAEYDEHDKEGDTDDDPPADAMEPTRALTAADVAQLRRGAKANAQLPPSKWISKPHPGAEDIDIAVEDTVTPRPPSDALLPTPVLSDPEPDEERLATVALPSFALSEGAANISQGRLRSLKTGRRSKVALRKTFDENLSYVEHESPALLYGRVDEVDSLYGAVRKAIEERQAMARMVVGPAGIGKTRLRTEIAKQVQTNLQPVRVFAGRAEESLRTAPFAFLRRMLFTLTGARLSDPPAVRRARIEEMIPPEPQLARFLDQEEDSMTIDTMELNDPLSAVRNEEWMLSQDAFVVGRTHGLFAPLEQDLASEARDTGVDRLPTLSGFDEPARWTPSIEESRALLVAFACLALRVPHPAVESLEIVATAPKLLSAQLRATLGLIMRVMVERTGLVIMVDDAHHLDHQSASCLWELFKSCEARGGALALLAYALPNILDRDTRSASPLASLEAPVLKLKKLNPRASREFARSLIAGEIHAGALETLVNRAAGSPLYLEQLIRAVEASGVLKEGETGEWMLHGIRNDETDVDRIPPTVAAAVSARMLRLNPRLARLLSIAAIFGEVFWLEGVARLSDQDVEQVTLDMDQLLLLNLVRRRKTSRYLGEIEMEFTHGVIRSVALSKLKKRKRGHLQERVADYLEDCQEADHAIIARHVALSGSQDEAVSLLEKAAAESLALGDLISATHLAEQGVRHAEGRPELVLQLSKIAFEVAIEQRDWHTAHEALDIIEALDLDAQASLELKLRRSELLLKEGDFERANSWAQRALSELDPSLRSSSAWTRLCAAEAAERNGDARQALRNYIGAHTLLVDEDSSPRLARATSGLARIAGASGDYRTAENRFREALLTSGQAKSVDGAVEAATGLAEIARRVGDFRGAHRLLERVAPAMVDPEGVFQVRLARARLWFDQGDIEQAATMLEGCAKVPNPSIQRRADLQLAQLLRDRRAEARCPRVDRRALALRLAQPSSLIAIQMAQAFIWAITDQPEKATKMAVLGKARFEETGVVPLDEAPCIFYTFARVLEMLSPTDNQAQILQAYQAAISQVDIIASRLDREARAGYFERFTVRSILLDAKAAGLEVTMDRQSFRVVAEEVEA